MNRWWNIIVLLPFFCLCVFSCFKKHPINENALLHQRLCIESIDINDYERALTHCELCLEFDKSMPECLNGIGLVALSNNDEEKAKTYFSNAIRHDNDFSQARNNLGVIFFNRGEFDMALRYFDRSLEIDPANTDARYNSGLAHFRLAQRQLANNKKEGSASHLLMAKDQMKKLLAIEPTYGNAFRDLGLIELNLYDAGEYETPRKEILANAKAAFTSCVEADKENDGCYEGLARVNFEEGAFDQSFTNYFACLNYSPNNSACRKGIVVAYEKSTKTSGTYQRFAKNTRANPDNGLAHEAFCTALFERGLDEEAVKECEVALRIKPDLCSVQFRLAEYFAKVLNPERAVSHCQAFFSCGSKGITTQVKKCQEIVATVKN